MAGESVKQLSMKRNMVWNSVGSITRLACNWLITVVVVRLTKDFTAAGVYALCSTVSNLIAPFADFRMRTVHVTDATGEHTTGEYIGMRIVTTVGAFLGGIIYSIITVDHDLLLVMTLFLISVLIPKFSEGLQAENQRQMRMDYNAISYIMQGVGSLVAFSLVLWSTDSLLWAVIALDVVELAILLFFEIPTTSRLADIRPVFNWEDTAKTLLKLTPLVLAQVAATAVLAVPKQYLGTEVGREALGIYNSVAAPAVIVQMGATYIYSPLMSEFAKRFHSDKKSALSLLVKATLAIIALGASISLGLFFFGDWALALVFGEKIAGHTYLLQPAILTTFIAAFCWFINDLLLALRDFRATFIGYVVASLVTLATYRWLISTFDMNGVSYTGIIAYLSGIAVMLAFLVRDYRALDS